MIPKLMEQMCCEKQEKMDAQNSLKLYARKYDDVVQNNEKVAKELESIYKWTNMTISKLSTTIPRKSRDKMRIHIAGTKNLEHDQNNMNQEINE